MAMFETLENYLNNLINFPHPKLKELYELARKEEFPVVEPSIGNLIYFFTRLLKPKLVVEFGSGFGYSALWVALACPDECTIYCFDYQEKNRKRAMEIFKTLEVEEKIRYLVGDAEVLFHDLGFEENSIDLVIFDHEKQRYSESLDLVFPKLKKGGIIIADDVLWKGKVFEPQKENVRVNALRFFNREIFQRENIASFICPLGDGVAVIQKL
jgi:caffeoyl-CoA O-methyltransferase